MSLLQRSHLQGWCSAATLRAGDVVKSRKVLQHVAGAAQPSSGLVLRALVHEQIRPRLDSGPDMVRFRSGSGPEAEQIPTRF